MKYSEMVGLARETRVLFEKFEQKTSGKTWGNEELLIGLVTDVGDLARLILAKEGFRSVSGSLEYKLRHELADCLWAIIVLAEKNKINLSEALQEMNKDIKKKLEHFDD